MHQHVLELALPKSAPVNYGVINIPHPLGRNECNFEGLDDVFRYVSCMNHMLSLIPESDFNSAEWNCIDGWDVMTSNMGAIKYALRSGYLNEYQTALHSAVDSMTAGIECSDCFQDIMDFVWDSSTNHDFEVKEVNGQLISFITEPIKKEKAIAKSNA